MPKQKKPRMASGFWLSGAGQAQVKSDVAAGGGMWLLWCVLVPVLQRWA
jgi:hypothetical protein